MELKTKDKIDSYQDLKAWHMAMELVIKSYEIVKQFPKGEQFWLTSQLQRAAVSIPANIAEGHGRSYRKEYLRHLSIAKGSLVELETHLQIANRLGYCNNIETKAFLSKTNSIGQMLTGLRKTLESNSSSPSPIP